jgi:predicted ArsR family transcriptional regulator
MKNQIETIGLLAEPTRYQLYRCVIAAGEPLSREEIAQRTGISAANAKFHLEKLVTAKLLAAEFRKPIDRSGPGSGRPTKLYKRDSRHRSVDLPPRRFELLSSLLADAIAESSRTKQSVTHTTRRLASDAGHLLGSQSDDDPGARRLVSVLSSLGYEPREDSSHITLTNCPFHETAETQRELVCGLNLSLVDGVIRGSNCPHAEAALEPGSGRCCVTISLTTPADAG